MNKRNKEEDDVEPDVLNKAKKPLLHSETGSINEESSQDDDTALRDLWLEKESKLDQKKCLKAIKLEKNMKMGLPDGWIGLCHQSGGIVYLHRPTRVCTWGRPYHLGEGSVRKHDVPTIAIPCLQQKKVTGQLTTNHGDGCLQTVSNGTCINNDHLSSSQDKGHGCACKMTDNSQIGDSNGHSNHGGSSHNHGNHHTSDTVNGDKDGGFNKDTSKLCTNSHHFDDHSGGVTNTSLTGTTGDQSSSTTEHNNKVDFIKTSEFSQYLAKLWQFQVINKEEEKNMIVGETGQKPDEDCSQTSTIPYLVDGVSKGQKKDVFLLNPVGKSPQSLLHEYCCRILKVKPVYKVKESGDPKRPFLATVEIDGLQYGSGLASNKKQSRHVAAQKTLQIFKPGTFERIMDIEQYLKLFDNVPIEDPNVYELTTKLGLMIPYQILTQCHQRNHGVLMSKIKCQMYQTEDKKLYYSIECGKFNAKVVCKNKKQGRELAAQALLKDYTKVNEVVDEPPLPEQEVNHGLLSDLKHDMWQLLKKQKLHATDNISGKFTDIKI